MEMQTDRATRVGKAMPLIEISRKGPAKQKTENYKHSEINCDYVFADVINKMQNHRMYSLPLLFYCMDARISPARPTRQGTHET